MLYMVGNFQKQGILGLCPGVENDPDLPPAMWVSLAPEDLSTAELKAFKIKATKSKAKLGVESFQHPTSPLQQAGWESEEQLEAFRKVVRW
jgi:hypothetical protein